MNSTGQQQPTGYRSPPEATRFRKGSSGNPKGRSRGSKSSIPYDTLLGQMVTIREDGRERRVTAAEAFVLQLTGKGLAGDSAAARASLHAIETARAARTCSGEDMPTVRIQFRPFGLCCTIEGLGIGVRINPHDQARVRLMLMPWIVEEALRRLGSRKLTVEEQRTVLASTRHPDKVRWPEWWTEHGA
jgi:hypothetical protein